MKHKNKLALMVAMGVALGSLGAYAQPDGSDASGPPPGGPHGRPNPGMLLLSLLDKYDTNHDGVLDATELAALKKDIQDGKIQPPGRSRGPGDGDSAGPRQPPSVEALLEKFDTNKDGKLDATELEALLKDLRAHRPPMGGPRGGFGGPPPGGDEGPQK